MQSLYDNLINLVETNDAFYFADQELDDVTYRIFNYRLASYTNFLLPDAMECRGVMFEVKDNKFVRLASRTMPKFFNINENPMTMDLDISSENIKSIKLKADGSLISSYLHKGWICLKSKGSIQSEQAVDSMNFLSFNKDLRDEMQRIAKQGWTINMEFTAPHNRIVINYPTVGLVILNVRHNDHGHYMERSELNEDDYPLMRGIWIEEFECNHSVIADTTNMKDIEGFVVELHNGPTFKWKTEWYVTQHRAKEHVDSPRRLFEAAIRESTDDLRSLFFDNDVVLQLIGEMEVKAQEIYTMVVSKVELFVDVNRDLIEADNRKEFAIRGQKELEGKIFGLAMTRYQQERGVPRDLDYKEFCIKHWKEWGIKDAPVPTE